MRPRSAAPGSVIGPFFLLASLLSVFRQTSQLSVDMEVPVLVTSIGVLLLVARLPAIPKPDWFVDLPPPAEEASVQKKLRLGHAPGRLSGSAGEDSGEPAQGR